MKTFNLRLLSADKLFYDGDCESLVCSTADGSFGVLADHANLIAALTPGPVTYKLPGEEKRTVVVSQGFLRVENNRVLVIALAMERPEDIDVRRAEQSLEEAKQELTRKQGHEEYLASKSKLNRAIARINASKYVKH